VARFVPGLVFSGDSFGRLHATRNSAKIANTLADFIMVFLLLFVDARLAFSRLQSALVGFVGRCAAKTKNQFNHLAKVSASTDANVALIRWRVNGFRSPPERPLPFSFLSVACCIFSFSLKSAHGIRMIPIEVFLSGSGGRTVPCRVDWE
jgi:hypothetical protein